MNYTETLNFIHSFKGNGRRPQLKRMRWLLKQAGNPQKAEQLYEYIIGECKKEIDIVQTGVFGAHMEVSLINDGPFTVVLEDL